MTNWVFVGVPIFVVSVLAVGTVLGLLADMVSPFFVLLGIPFSFVMYLIMNWMCKKHNEVIDKEYSSRN